MRGNLKRINLSPRRVAQSMFAVLVDIGTPTKMPLAEGKVPRLGKRQGTYSRQRVIPLLKNGFQDAKSLQD